MYFNYPVYFEFLRKAKNKFYKTSIDLVQDIISNYSVDDVYIDHEFDFNGAKLYQYMCLKLGNKLNQNIQFPEVESVLEKELFENKTDCFHEMITRLVSRYINLTNRNNDSFMSVCVFKTQFDYEEAKTVIKDIIEKFFMKTV